MSEFASFEERLDKIREFENSSNMQELSTAFNLGHPL
jgi:hypothetical protein